jgi:hypothetical protein
MFNPGRVHSAQHFIKLDTLNSCIVCSDLATKKPVTPTWPMLDCIGIENVHYCIDRLDVVIWHV